MSSDSFLDRVRDLAEGRLSTDEARRLELELAADPELRELADEFTAVHAVTGAGDAGVPRPALDFATLERRLASDRAGRWTRARRVAAAAVILALAGAALLSWPRPAASAEPLVLSAIRIADGEDPPGPGPVPPPAFVAEFDPRKDGSVQWIADLSQAAWLARAARRPLLVYGTIDGCPMCAVLDEELFTDPQVVDLAERYVPVRIDFGAMPRARANALMARGYPFLEVWDDEQVSQHRLFNRPDASVFVESLHDGLDASGATGEVPSWEALRSLAKLFDAAVAGEANGRMGEALERFESLRERATDEVFAELADSGLHRIGNDARKRLLEARRVARDDPGRAARILAEGAERFSGTAYADDLRAALERLERDGRFPEIAAPAS